MIVVAGDIFINEGTREQAIAAMIANASRSVKPRNVIVYGVTIP